MSLDLFTLSHLILITIHKVVLSLFKIIQLRDDRMGIWSEICLILGFPDGSSGRETACNAGDIGDMDTGLNLGSGRSSGGENGNPLHYFSLENPMDRGAWRAIVQRSQRIEHDWATKHSHAGKKKSKWRNSLIIFLLSAHWNDDILDNELNKALLKLMWPIYFYFSLQLLEKS